LLILPNHEAKRLHIYASAAKTFDFHPFESTASVKDVLPENVPVDVVEHRIPEEERICDEYRTVMQAIDKEVRRTLQIIPAQMRICED